LWSLSSLLLPLAEGSLEAKAQEAKAQEDENAGITKMKR
jgi:hypothetical protein